jgi:hypothetical protein
MRRVWLILGGLTVFLTFFTGTLVILDYIDPAASRNRTRAEHAKLLGDALQKFKNARGGYPVGSGGLIDEIRKDVVDGGFLSAMPRDPKGQSYSYVGGGDRYGLLFVLEAQPALMGTRPALICLSGVKIKGQGAWGDPPECPF